MTANSVGEVLAKCRELRVALRPEGDDRLRFESLDREPVPEELISLLRSWKPEILELFRREAIPEWPPECRSSERTFEHPGALLYPLIGKRVRTPQGVGVLLQVLGEARVLLEGDDRMTSFDVEEIAPADDRATLEPGGRTCGWCRAPLDDDRERLCQRCTDPDVEPRPRTASRFSTSAPRRPRSQSVGPARPPERTCHGCGGGLQPDDTDHALCSTCRWSAEHLAPSRAQ